jgi:hypothetical protein
VRNLILLLTIFLFSAVDLSAQCNDLADNCPEDLSYSLEEGETDTMFIVPPPDTSQCGATNLYYTIDGSVGAAGQGVPGEFEFRRGITELTYQYTESRCGDFTQNATLLPDGNGTEYEVPFFVLGMGINPTVGDGAQLPRRPRYVDHLPGRNGGVHA